MSFFVCPSDHTKKHQDPQCPSIKKEVEEESPHIKEEEEPGHHCAGSHQDSLLASRSDCDISSHPSDSDTDDERSKGDVICHADNKPWNCS